MTRLRSGRVRLTGSTEDRPCGQSAPAAASDYARNQCPRPTGRRSDASRPRGLGAGAAGGGRRRSRVVERRCRRQWCGVCWCHDRDGITRCVVAEVHNTIGERHSYLLFPDGRTRHAPTRSSTSRRSSPSTATTVCACPARRATRPDRAPRTCRRQAFHRDRPREPPRRHTARAAAAGRTPSVSTLAVSACTPSACTCDDCRPAPPHHHAPENPS